MNWVAANWVEAIGYVGTALTIASTAMSTMIPLRVVSLLASVAVITYGILTGSMPVVLTEAIQIPFNAWRLYQMIRLVRDVERAAGRINREPVRDRFRAAVGYRPSQYRHRDGRANERHRNPRTEDVLRRPGDEHQPRARSAAGRSMRKRHADDRRRRNLRRRSSRNDRQHRQHESEQPHHAHSPGSWRIVPLGR